MRITPRTYTAADPYLAAIETCLNVLTFDCAYMRDALMSYYLVFETQDRSSHVEAINQISSTVDAIVMGEEVDRLTGGCSHC